MDTSEIMKLLKQVEPHRNEDVLLEGELVPKSASMLVSRLNAETDQDDRYDLYGHILLECQLANKMSAAVKFALARYEEFRDVTSLIAYSKALVDNGELAAGLSRAKEAVDLAIQKQTLVNYAAGNLMRQSIKTGSVKTVNEALRALLLSIQVPRKGDCALEVDWVDAAEEIGADAESISRVRSVAVPKDK
jgi:hypothetical protein